MKVAVYARVSTDEQELAQQIAACENYCRAKGLEVVQVYSEVASGYKANRPQLDLLRQHLRAGLYTGVVAFRLDRLGRSSRDLVLFIEEMENRGIHIFSLHESFDTSTAIGRAMRDIIIVLAQLEREQISEATKQRLAALKASGKRLGRPQAASKYQVRKVRSMKASGASLGEIVKATHLSRGTVRKIVQQTGGYGVESNHPLS